MKPNRKLRVGVTIHIRDGQQSIWENGIFQNCVFLVQLFNLSPEVEKAVLVNGSGAREVHPSMMFDQAGVEMIDLHSALEILDVVVEMSSQVPEDWLEKFRARGGRIAWMRCGNDLVIDIERAMNNLPHAGLCSAKVYDAVWTLPEYAHTCVDYFAITTRAPVKIVPHLWTPEFFDKGIASLPQGVRFGYQPGKSRWRICCFEPNMCMVKTSITPMLVCEEAYRKSPQKFEHIRICNTLKAKENPAFVRFARFLDIVNHGVASFEGRFAVYEYMAHYGDCIVSHHWENGQNYLYYEALYGGYPLIHNSEFIRELGYFYPDFDCQAGGEALTRAFETHDANLAEYRKKSSEFLQTLDIRHPPNIEAYTAELVALFAATPHRPGSKRNPKKMSFETVADQKPHETGTAARRVDGVYVINLDRRPDRLQRFSKNHPDLAGRFKRFAACDGKTLQLTPALARLFAPNNFNWHKATMGCAMSHLALWKNLSQRPGESWLIMEDDARLSSGWESAVESALKGSFLPEDWEVLFLGGVLPRHRETFEKNVEQLGGGIARVRPDCVLGNNPPGYFHFCAYAYLLSHRGALRLLDLVKQGGGIWMQADFLLACSKPGLGRKIFFLHPLRAESFQDSEPGFAQPYGEGGPSAEVVDSDIWREQDRFTEEQVAAVRNVSHPLNHPAALATQKTSIPAPPKIPPAIDKIWVINLERRRDRLEKFQAGHPDIVGEIEVLKAYDGRTLRLTPKIARLFAPNEFRWNKATMGCSLSHLDLWYKLANEPEENARYLILEDDARLSPGWRDMVECSFANGDVPADWDVLYLGGVLPKNADAFQKCKEKVSGNIFQVAPNSWFGQNPPNRYFHFCANAHLLSRKGACKLLDFIKIKNGIWPQADFLLGYVTPENYPIQITHYFFEPCLAHCFQDFDDDLLKPYSDNSQEGSIDSDIWKESNCFDETTAKGLISISEPYDICGALEDAKAALDEILHNERSESGILEIVNPQEINNANSSFFRTDTAIALCADSTYFAYSSVVILTLIENGKCADYPIFLFAEEFHEEDIQKFRNLALMVGCRITLVPLGEHALKELPPCGHMSRATYLRLLIPSILQDFKKILYLDSDLLVLNDLRGLLETDVSGQPVAAARDIIGEKCCKIDFFKSGEKQYFNAGVLLINTEEWNQQKISEKVIEIARNDSERARLSAFADQCLLNYVICGEFLELDKRFNWATFEPRNCSPGFLQMAPTPRTSDLSSIKILHFTGHCKPWMPESSLESIRGLYKSHLDRSPWRANFTSNKKIKIKQFSKINSTSSKLSCRKKVIRYCISHEPPMLPQTWFDDVIKLGDYGRESDSHVSHLSSFWDEFRALSYGAAGSYCIPYAVKKLKELPDFIEINSFRKRVLSSKVGKPSPNYPLMREIDAAKAAKIDEENENLSLGNFLVCLPHHFPNGYLEQYAYAHHRRDFLDYARLAIDKKIISKDDYQDFLDCKTFIPGGCELGIYPCKWLLGILSQLEKLGRHYILKYKDRIANYDPYQVRCIGFLSERLGSFLLLRELTAKFNNQIPATIFGHMTTVVPDEKSSYQPAVTRSITLAADDCPARDQR